jgi:hypothetical protein
MSELVLRRLAAEGLDIPLDGGLDRELQQGIGALLAADGLDGLEGDASIRITVSRGEISGRGLLPPDRPNPTVVIQAWPVPAPPVVVQQNRFVIATNSRRKPVKSWLSCLAATNNSSNRSASRE